MWLIKRAPLTQSLSDWWGGVQEVRMLNRYEPFGQAMGLRQVMDRLLQDAVVMPSGGGSQAWGGPPVDVYEEGDTLIVEAHAPGFKPEHLDINVERGILTISGQSEAEEERKERQYLIREQRGGRFSRSLQLPPSYTADPTQATFEHGVLRLVFPKAEEAKPRRIQLSGASGGSQQVPTNGRSKAQPAGAGTKS
jgi:HSP20 family protein